MFNLFTHSSRSSSDSQLIGICWMWWSSLADVWQNDYVYLYCLKMYKVNFFSKIVSTFADKICLNFIEVSSPPTISKMPFDLKISWSYLPSFNSKGMLYSITKWPSSSVYFVSFWSWPLLDCVLYEYINFSWLFILNCF